MNFACSSEKGCSRVPFDKSRFGPAAEIARNVFFITGKPDASVHLVQPRMTAKSEPDWHFTPGRVCSPVSRTECRDGVKVETRSFPNSLAALPISPVQPAPSSLTHTSRVACDLHAR